MPSSEYFRRQADICRQLVDISSSKEAANRLLVMARDYQTKVDAIEAESAMPMIIAPSASPDRQTNGCRCRKLNLVGVARRIGRRWAGWQISSN
jgi:hypothetical protein